MKTFFALAMVAVASQTAFAFPGFEILQEQAVNKAVNRSWNAPAAASSSCTDFSGKWKGECSVAGLSQELTIDIKQSGCTMIQMGNDLVAIGGLKNETQALPALVDGKTVLVAGSVATDWNEDQSQLKSKFTGLVKLIGSSTSVPLSGQGSTRLEGKKLIQELDMGGIKFSCTYDKE